MLPSWTEEQGDRFHQLLCFLLGTAAVAHATVGHVVNCSGSARLEAIAVPADVLLLPTRLGVKICWTVAVTQGRLLKARQCS